MYKVVKKKKKKKKKKKAWEHNLSSRFFFKLKNLYRNWQTENAPVSSLNIKQVYSIRYKIIKLQVITNT